MNPRARLAAPLTCPACRSTIGGQWNGTRTATQTCPDCGHVFDATWPGFPFQPETIHRPR